MTWQIVLLALPAAWLVYTILQEEYADYSYDGSLMTLWLVAPGYSLWALLGFGGHLIGLGFAPTSWSAVICLYVGMVVAIATMLVRALHNLTKYGFPDIP